jgi:hypothetical protein
MLVKYLLLAAAVGFIINTWRRERAGELTRLGAIVWSVLWGAVGVVALFPGLASWLASTIGVGRGADAVLYLSIIVLFWLIFRLAIRQRQQERELTKLVRALALKELGEKDLTKGK